MNPAQNARLSKEKYPSDWCKTDGCLWRCVTPRGYKPCPKHSEAERNTVSCGGSPSNGASESDEGKARSTVRSRAELLANHDPRTCEHPHCRLAF